MRIHHNVASLNAWRHLSATSERMNKRLEQLSSGYRVNRAADDVAGLAISERMRSGIRSMRMNLRNIQDGISVAQVLDGAMHEVHALLQRGRELSVQASNGTLQPEDRQMIHTEAEHILKEIQRIAGAATFNGKPLINTADPRKEALIHSLRTVWLRRAEELVEQHYGLTGDNVPLEIHFAESGDHDAWVQGTIQPDGTWGNLRMYVNMSAFDNFDLPNGGAHPNYVDRLIAHEMVHAVMSRNMNYNSLPNWFREGTAEFIHGADERLAYDLDRIGGIANLVNEIDSFEGHSYDYSVGYLAVKYMHHAIDDAGGSGVRDIMTYLSNNRSDTLNEALANASAGAFTGLHDFIDKFKADAATFLATLDLTDPDTGAIGGGNAEDVMPDDPITGNPLLHFTVSFAEDLGSFNPIGPLQVGMYTGHIIGMPEVTISLYSLGLLDINLMEDASAAIDKFDAAINRLSSMRSQVGAAQNRLEHSYNVTVMQIEQLVGSESKIRDVDMAEAMTAFVKEQLLLQASTAMLAQANSGHVNHMRSLLQAL